MVPPPGDPWKSLFKPALTLGVITGMAFSVASSLCLWMAPEARTSRVLLLLNLPAAVAGVLTAPAWVEFWSYYLPAHAFFASLQWTLVALGVLLLRRRRHRRSVPGPRGVRPDAMAKAEVPSAPSCPICRRPYPVGSRTCRCRNVTGKAFLRGR